MLRQAVFLVGGRGTRLGSLTADMPKPLLPVGGIPFLRRAMDDVARYGVEEMVLLAGFKSERLQPFIESLADRPYRVRLIVEPRESGTGGALTWAADVLDDRFFLLNGDSFFDVNLLELARAARPFKAMLALRPLADTARFGSVQIEGSTITSFREKVESAGEGLINGGVYVLDKAVLREIGDLPCSLERDVFPRLIATSELGGQAFRAYFCDIGVPDAFEQAQTSLPRHLRRPVLFLDRDGVINVDSGYPHLPEHIVWIDGAIDAIRLANNRGYQVVVVTNQAGVAHGYYEEARIGELHAWMQSRFREAGAHVDRFLYCAHHPQGAIPRYRLECACRKPGAGMILEALEGDVDRQASFLIGDKPSDVEAARRAGIAGYLFAGGNLKDFCDPLLHDRNADAST